MGGRIIGEVSTLSVFHRLLGLLHIVAKQGGMLAKLTEMGKCGGGEREWLQMKDPQSPPRAQCLLPSPKYLPLRLVLILGVFADGVADLLQAGHYLLERCVCY